MRGIRYGHVPPRMARAAERFAHWRRSRAIGSRIPKSLWAAAVRLASEFGISRTASCLKLDYYELKRHLESLAVRSTDASPSRATADRPSTAFVEWPASALATPAECIIELETAKGSKMRIHLKGTQTPDLAAFSQSFWSSLS